MGEVYRARDTRLGRDVALKIVNSAEADEETLRRFENEARAVSALNHPNILTVHEFGREDNRAFLVTELVEGQSLRQILQSGPLPMRKVLDYGLQIAEGVAAAHDEGIVHRDLKPENIMITRDDRVKILDFGIAKVAEDVALDSSRTLGANETAPGLLLGTTAYMSPEQARGTRVTYFTDQFALGLILYEMAMGEPAFRRDTSLATLSAVLTEEPPELMAGSMAFRWLVKRLLHKEPDHRYRSMHDVLRELHNARTALSDHATPTPVMDEAPEPRRRWFRLWWALAAVALAAVAAAVWYFQPMRMATEFTPFATSAGVDVTPAWSPDGRTVAWSGEVKGVLQIFTRGTDSYQSAQITSGRDDALFPFWSPDGARIYYLSGGALWAVGVTGGDPELLLREVAQATVAKDGRTFAVLRPDSFSSGYRIFVGSLDKLEAVSGLVQPWSYLRFAPEGDKLGAWVSLSDGRSEFRVIAGGKSDVKLKSAPVTALAREFAWIDGSRVVFSDRSGLSLHSHLYVGDLRLNKIQPLTSGTGSELSPSAFGRQVAFAAASLDYDIVEVRFDGTLRTLQASTRFEVSPSGQMPNLAWVTDRNGSPELWYNDRPLVTPSSFPTVENAFLFDTELSPDGRRVAFRRSGTDDESIWIATVAGGTPVRLTPAGGRIQRGPTWSADANEIAYFSIENGRFVLMRARVGGTEKPVVIAENAGTYPRWSPRGDLIAAVGPAHGLTLLAPDGTGRRTVGTGIWLVHGWSKDGTTIFGVRRSSDRKMEVVSVEIASGRESVLGSMGQYPASFTYGAALGSLPMRGFTMSADGGGFITSVLRAESDIWILKR